MRFPLVAVHETIKFHWKGPESRMTIQAILGSKGREVATIGSDSTLSEAVAVIVVRTLLTLRRAGRSRRGR